MGVSGRESVNSFSDWIIDDKSGDDGRASSDSIESESSDSIESESSDLSEEYSSDSSERESSEGESSESGSPDDDGISSIDGDGIGSIVEVGIGSMNDVSISSVVEVPTGSIDEVGIISREDVGVGRGEIREECREDDLAITTLAATDPTEWTLDMTTFEGDDLAITTLPAIFTPPTNGLATQPRALNGLPNHPTTLNPLSTTLRLTIQAQTTKKKKIPKKIMNLSNVSAVSKELIRCFEMVIRFENWVYCCEVRFRVEVDCSFHEGEG